MFTEAQWDEIARSIPLDKLPEEMKQAICNALRDYTLMHNDQSEGSRSPRRALLDLVKLTSKLGPKLNELQGDLRSEYIIDKVEILIEVNYAVHKAAVEVLPKLDKSKGGRPRQIDRDILAQNLFEIFVRFSGKAVGLSRSPDNENPENPDRLKPGGPCYRFVSTIFKLYEIPLEGLEHVIEGAARHSKNRPPKNEVFGM